MWYSNPIEENSYKVGEDRPQNTYLDFFLLHRVGAENSFSEKKTHLMSKMLNRVGFFRKVPM